MIVYGPGGYRFRDFVKVGLPLNIIIMIVALIVIPRVWHF
jgi:di/tricarboxylate transporter